MTHNLKQWNKIWKKEPKIEKKKEKRLKNVKKRETIICSKEIMKKLFYGTAKD